MPKSQDTTGRMLLKIGAQPLLLGRSRLTASHRGALAIQRNDVPGAKIKAVIAFARLSRPFAEIFEITRRPGGPILMIAWGGPGAVLMASPSLVVTAKVLVATARIS